MRLVKKTEPGDSQAQIGEEGDGRRLSGLFLSPLRVIAQQDSEHNQALSAIGSSESSVSDSEGEGTVTLRLGEEDFLVFSTLSGLCFAGP